MVDVDDRKHLYEVRETEDFESTKGAFANRYPDVQIQEQQSKWPWMIVTGLVAVIFLILIILLGVNGVTLTHLNTLPICDQSTVTATANTSGLTSGGGNTTSTGGGNSTSTGGGCSSITCNCSVETTWSPAVAEQVNRILNMTSANSWKIDSIVNYTTIDAANANSAANLLNQIGQNLNNQIGQVLTTTQDTATKVDDIRTFTIQQTVDTENITNTLQQALQKTTESAQRLTDIVNTLSNIKDTGITTAGVIDDILLIADELLSLHNASSIFNSITPVSCADIKNVLPNSPSGYYHVNSRNIYCNMEQLCNSSAGWTRLAYLDMSDATVNCPSGFRLYQSGGVRACGRANSSGGSCSSVQFPSNGINYSQVCGRVTGYQNRNTDGFLGSNNNINSYYVDGVSITRGSPRQHVWTLVSGLKESLGNYVGSNCPCSVSGPNNVPSFVGDNYFCESGNPSTNSWSGFYLSDPLWDGLQCGPNEINTCCTASGLPWFHRDYVNTTTDYLELRICSNEPTWGEGTPVNAYEIYVQ